MVKWKKDDKELSFSDLWFLQEDCFGPQLNQELKHYTIIPNKFNSVWVSNIKKSNSF